MAVLPGLCRPGCKLLGMPGLLPCSVLIGTSPAANPLHKQMGVKRRQQTVWMMNTGVCRSQTQSAQYYSVLVIASISLGKLWSASTLALLLGVCHNSQSAAWCSVSYALLAHNVWSVSEGICFTVIKCRPCIMQEASCHE